MAGIRHIMASFGRFSLLTSCSSELSDKEFGVRSPRLSVFESSGMRIPRLYESLFTRPSELVVEEVGRLMEKLPGIVGELEESVQKVCVKDDCGIQNKKILVLGTGQSSLLRRRTLKLTVN